MLLFKRYSYDPKTDLIGKGGFSRVYKAWDTENKFAVALKVYKSNELSDRYSPVAEIKRVINLEHPNICKYLGIEEIEEEDSFGQVEKIQVCVMELLDGGTFAGYYNLNRDINIFKKLLIDVLNGLLYLHKNGIIHRDIKPANILISRGPSGQPVAKITDFGLSKRTDALENSSSSGLLISVPYMAPEQLNPEKYGIDQKIHPNIDLWSVGVTVYEVLSNDILFKNFRYDSPEQVMANIISQEIPEKIKKLPEPFSRFVAMCLVKDAKLRVKTADELLELLGTESLETKAEANDEVKITTDFKEDASITENDTRIISADDTMALQPFNESDETKDGDETRLITNKKTADQDSKKNKEAGENILSSGMSPKNQTDIPELLQTRTNKENSNITLFNRYSYNPLTDLIGRGGFSRVYSANDQKLGRPVALKIYKTSEFSERYSAIAEIRRVVNLDHPNICRYLDIEELEKLNPFGETEKVQVCVMELLDSGNLSEYFARCGKDIDIFKKLLQDIIHGIAYLHKNGIIHRDIKPANILIKKTIEGPVAKITDFGISKVSDSVNNHTTSALIVSIPYMAPEQLNIKKYGINESISFNLDLWSLGVTIYEVITGNVLFKNSEQDSSEQIMANIMAPELPEKINVLPQPFRNIVSHCIVKNANERAQKAEELLVLLNSMITHIPSPPMEEEATINYLSAPVNELIPAIKPEIEIIPEPEIKLPEPETVDLPEKPAAPEIKRKIFIAEPAPEIEKRAKKRINILKLSIAGAALLLILASVFYYNLSKEQKNAEPVVKNSDSLNNNHLNTTSGSLQDSNRKVEVVNTSKITADTLSVLQKKQTPLRIEKKKDKPVETTLNNTNTETAQTNSSIRVDVIFVFTCPGYANINKNGIFYMKINDNEHAKIRLYEGVYSFNIVCDNGSQGSKAVTISSSQTGKKGFQKVIL